MRPDQARPRHEPARMDCRDRSSIHASRRVRDGMRGQPWVIIGRLVSLSSRRLAATLVAMIGSLVVCASAVAATIPDSTWVPLPPLASLPKQGQSPVFALAVDPSNNQAVLAGNGQGSLLRSTDGGSTWTTVHTGRIASTTIAFVPFTPGQVMAGTRGAGALISTDAGAKWSAVTGLDRRHA